MEKKAGHPRFYELLEKMSDLHLRKNQDYSGDKPLANLKECEKLGISAWKGVLIRLSDKYSRIMQLANNEAQVKEESIIDTLMDQAVYSLLCIILLEEDDEEDDEEEEDDDLYGPDAKRPRGPIKI